MTTVDLNADLAEGFGAYRCGDDEAMLGIVTSANVACGLHAGDPEIMAGDLPLRMATQNGAKALGWPDSGVIQPGALADLILLNADSPHWRPRHDLVANLLHSAQAGDVSHAMVAGRWLMKDRQLLTGF